MLKSRRFTVHDPQNKVAKNHYIYKNVNTFISKLIQSPEIIETLSSSVVYINKGGRTIWSKNYTIIYLIHETPEKKIIITNDSSQVWIG